MTVILRFQVQEKAPFWAIHSHFLPKDLDEGHFTCLAIGCESVFWSAVGYLSTFYRDANRIATTKCGKMWSLCE